MRSCSALPRRARRGRREGGAPHLGFLPLGLVSLGCLLLAVLAETAEAQTTFVDESAARGLTAFEALSPGFGFGVAAADYDDDGDVDMFLPAGRGTPHRLYRNDGSGQFSDVAADVGLDRTEGARAALWIDVDGDHRLDLVMGGDCYAFACPGASLIHLYRQRFDGTFEDVTSGSGLTYDGLSDGQHRSGFAAGDVNADGFLDLVSTEWTGSLRLFVNQGDGTFLDETMASGLAAEELGYHQPVLVDLDANGFLDLYVSVDVDENRLWLNTGVVDGIASFVEVAATSGCDNAMNDMGLAAGDFDEDGDPDLYVTNIYGTFEHNILLRMDSTTPLLFSEVSGAAGVQDGAWGWGTTFADVDNDSYLDLAETNGWSGSTWEAPPRLFMHQGDMPPTYLDQAPESGLTEVSWGSSLIAFDADRDGDLDILQTVVETAPESDYLSLYDNRLQQTGGGAQVGSGVHYLLVRPRMAGPNQRAIGARVVVEAGKRIWSRWILAGGSYLGQEPAEAFFGLGAADIADRVRVLWPGGLETSLAGISADRTLTVESGVIFASGFETGTQDEW